MDTESEIDIEYIEAEIGTGSEAVAQFLTVDGLFFVSDMVAEHTEGDIEGDILHDEDTDTGRERELSLHVGGLSVFRLAVVGATERTVAGSEGKFHLIEDSESVAPAEEKLRSSSKSTFIDPTPAFAEE